MERLKHASYVFDAVDCDSYVEGARLMIRDLLFCCLLVGNIEANKYIFSNVSMHHQVAGLSTTRDHRVAHCGPC